MQKIYIAIVLSIAFIGCTQTSGTNLVVNNIPPKKTFVIKESKDGDKSDERYDDYYYGNCRFYHCHEGYIGNGPLTYQGSHEDRENR